MRIIAGRFRRRTIQANPGMVTRPITDRIKEILFERLGPDVVENRRVADIFSGTGTLGLEALSRGASSVVFFEQDAKAYELLRENVEKLGVEDETLCWKTDVFRTSFRPKNVDEMLPFELVFFDPPYKLVETMQPGRPLYKSLSRLARDGVTADDVLMVFRTPADAAFVLPEPWTREDTWQRSGMDLHLYSKSPVSDES